MSKRKVRNAIMRSANFLAPARIRFGNPALRGAHEKRMADLAIRLQQSKEKHHGH